MPGKNNSNVDLDSLAGQTQVLGPDLGILSDVSSVVKLPVGLDSLHTHTESEAQTRAGPLPFPSLLRHVFCIAAMPLDTLLYSLQPSGLCQYSYPEGPKGPSGRPKATSP